MLTDPCLSATRNQQSAIAKMTAGEAKLDLQAVLLIPKGQRAPNIGPKTRAAFELLATTPNDREWPPSAAVPVIDQGPRRISEDGLSLVKEFEGLYLRAYQDTGGVWTIGWGHTGLQHMDGTVRSGRSITRLEAEQLLAYDMHQFERRVASIIGAPLNDDQFSALVSFDFNTGGLTLRKGEPSTLTRKLNGGDYDGAANELLKWNKDNGRVLRGLTRRRQSEKNLFEGKRPFIVPA